MQKRNFVIRTIRNGEVKIFHKIFVPSDKWLEYDGRLDGLRVAFGLYWRDKEWQDSYIYLWGTDEDYNTILETVDEFREWFANEEEDTLLGLVDGHFPWAWWYKKEK